jgi:hypothetical protein
LAGRRRPAIRVVTEREEDDWPDPIATYLIERPDELRVYLRSLPSGSPVAILLEPGAGFDLQSYSAALREIALDQRDVVLVTPRR